ncbi:hypothetical protein EZS27_031250 [termite gut metagenome]|uniref:Glycosyltransferase 2-like domain-containing protein n=1 Tax=termite gut metagenome TaxID=433724 RepID=A0A5J4QBC2_9ZZZZ
MKCLENLYVAIEHLSYNNINFDIYLTDDNSHDGTWEAIKEKFPNVFLIKGDGYLYWCRGMINIWKYAIGKKDYDGFFWLNDDSYIYNNAIEIMLSTFKQTGNLSIISGAFISELTGKVSYGGKINEKLLIPNGRLQNFVQLNGNFVFISKCVFTRVGFLDNTFHHGYGDYDYGYRAIKLGINLYLTPTYVGVCERNVIIIPNFFDNQYFITKRFRYLYSPLGPSPIISFKFNIRHFSLIKALLSFFSTNLMCLFPIIYRIRFLKNY